MSLKCGGVIATFGSSNDVAGAPPLIAANPSQGGCIDTEEVVRVVGQRPVEGCKQSSIPLVPASAPNDNVVHVNIGAEGSLNAIDQPDSRAKMHDMIIMGSDILCDFSDSELCIDDTGDDVSVLTSDTCFTSSSAISEADSQLCVQDEVEDYDDLTHLTPDVLNYSKSSIPSLTATENNAAQCISSGGDDSFGQPPPGFEAVLSEVRTNVQRRQRDRLARSFAYQPLEALKPLPGFEAVLSDVRTAAHRRKLRRQATLSAISETAPSDTQDDSSASRASTDALVSSVGSKIEQLPTQDDGKEDSSLPVLKPQRSESSQGSSPQSSLPPPIPPPQCAQSVSGQLSQQSIPIVTTEEETIYTAVADPLVSVNSTLTISERSLFIRKGRCPTCGIQTHKMKGMFKKSYRPLSNEHVLSGRCLICNPINVITNQVVAFATPTSSSEVEVNNLAPDVAVNDCEALPAHRDGKVSEIGTTMPRAPTPTPSAPSLEMCSDSDTGGCDCPKPYNGQKKYFSRTESRDEVEQWLLYHLPTLQKQDIDRYYDCFADEGFDSIAMLEVVEEADLSFMKTAHRRVLLKRLQIHTQRLEDTMSLSLT